MTVSKIQQIRPHILKSSGGHRYAGGWLPDRPKLQDWRLEKRLGDTLKSATPVNPGLDISSYPSIRDQGELGSCVSHAVRNALMVHLVKRNPELWREKYDLSPMALYYYGREKIQMIGVDSGAYVRDVVDAARENGAPREDNCPYIVSKFTKAPSATARTAGKWHQAVRTYRCDVEGAPNETTVDNILHSLQAGMPVVFGFTCYDNLGEADSNGVIPMPTARSQEEGGHGVCIYKADTNSRYFIGPNSWSEQWGAKVGDHRGYFLLPFDYALRGLADDFWSLDIE